MQHECNISIKNTGDITVLLYAIDMKYFVRGDHLGELSKYLQQRSIETFRLKYDKYLDTHKRHTPMTQC